MAEQIPFLRGLKDVGNAQALFSAEVDFIMNILEKVIPAGFIARNKSANGLIECMPVACDNQDA